MAVTIRDIAKEANVSVRTATRVINKEPRVRPKTRSIVEDAVARLGWQPNAHARRLVRGCTDSLGVIVPDSRNTIFSDIAEVIETRAQASGYDCLFLHSNGQPTREAKFLNLAVDGSVDGLILISNLLPVSHEIFGQLLKHRIPMVFRSGPEAPDTVDHVAVDLEKAVYLATRHLLSLGHTNVGTVFHEAERIRTRGRIAGYVRACDERNVPVRPELHTYSGYRIEDGYQAIRHLLQNRPEVTAIVCHNDQLALGAFRAAREMNRRIPHDLAVVGYDNIELARFCEVPLSTVGYSKELMGQFLVDMICRRIRNPDYPPEHVTLPPELIIRESCGYGARQ